MKPFPPRGKIAWKPWPIAPGERDWNPAMEIGISKMGALRILSVKGNLRLQHWRVIDKHLDALLAHGASWVALDLSEATLNSEAGIESLVLRAREFSQRQAHLLIQSDSAFLREALQASLAATGPGDCVFADRRSLEESLRGRASSAPSVKLD